MAMRAAVLVTIAILSLATVAALAQSTGAGAPRPGATVVIRFRGGKLWLRTQQAPVRDVLEAVATKTHVRFVAATEIGGEPLTLDIRGMPLERAIRSLVSSIREVAGHTMSYERDESGATRLVEVELFVAGKPPAAPGGGVVYGVVEPANASGLPPLDVEAQVEKMVAAGVPRDQAEKVMALTQEVRQLQATPLPGAYRAEDLSPASREKLQPLLDGGVSLDRAVQMLLLQERYQTMLKEITPIVGVVIPTPPPPGGP